MNTETFKAWLGRQRHRSDEVGFIARLALADDCTPELTAALDDPQLLARTYRSVEGKVARSMRAALAEWESSQARSSGG